jgi:hypothetical protein
MHVERKGRGLDQIKNNYGSLSGHKRAESRQYFGRLNSVYLKWTPTECEAKTQNHKACIYARESILLNLRLYNFCMAQRGIWLTAP